MEKGLSIMLYYIIFVLFSKIREIRLFYIQTCPVLSSLADYSKLNADTLCLAFQSRRKLKETVACL